MSAQSYRSRALGTLSRVRMIEGGHVWSVALSLANFLSKRTPTTRSFRLRRTMFVRAGARIAPSARVCGGVTLMGNNVAIGEESWLGAGTTLISTTEASVTIGDRCDVAPEVLFVVGTHELGSSERRGGRGASRSIAVGSGTWIGARATFIAGASVGNGCVVAAGSVVTRHFPDDVLVGGVPAKVIRSLASCDQGEAK